MIKSLKFLLEPPTLTSLGFVGVFIYILADRDYIVFNTFVNWIIIIGVTSGLLGTTMYFIRKLIRR